MPPGRQAAPFRASNAKSAQNPFRSRRNRKAQNGVAASLTELIRQPDTETTAVGLKDNARYGMQMSTTPSWRQPRRTNHPSAAVQCPTCGAEPGWRCTVSAGGASRRSFHRARIRSAAAVKRAQTLGLESAAEDQSNNPEERRQTSPESVGTEQKEPTPTGTAGENPIQ